MTEKQLNELAERMADNLQIDRLATREIFPCYMCGGTMFTGFGGEETQCPLCNGTGEIQWAVLREAVVKDILSELRAVAEQARRKELGDCMTEIDDGFVRLFGSLAFRLNSKEFRRGYDVAWGNAIGELRSRALPAAPYTRHSTRGARMTTKSLQERAQEMDREITKIYLAGGSQNFAPLILRHLQEVEREAVERTWEITMKENMDYLNYAERVAFTQDDLDGSRAMLYALIGIGNVLKRISAQ